MERLLEFALGVGGGSFLVNRKTFRDRLGFVVLPEFSSFPLKIVYINTCYMRSRWVPGRNSHYHVPALTFI